MTNDRLRSRLAARGMTTVDLASAVDVDPKTVERWLANGRIPHPRQRSLAAEVLDTDEIYLWPQLLDDPRVQSTRRSEVLAVYPTRGEVPAELWRRLIDSATRNIDVLVYSGLFLLDSHPDLPATLVEKAASGLEARFLYGDPDSEIVAVRGEEEGIGANLAARIRISLNYMRPVVGAPGVELRQHKTVLYNSIYRFDDELLINTHVLGSPAPNNPVLYLRHSQGGGIFDQHVRAFEKAWSQSVTFHSASSADTN